MTTPGFDITELVPAKYKAWVGAFSTLLGFAIPYVLTIEKALPSPWPAVIGIVITALSWLGIYKTPYKPSGDAVLVHQSQVTVSAPPPAVAGAPADVGEPQYRNPWKPQR